MLALVQPLAAESVPLQSALGRVLTQNIVAIRDQPPFAASAMDGYAVRSSDAPGNLRLIGEASAGHGFEGRCESGAAVRISTGAAMPEGADTVIIQEDVRRDGDGITVPAIAAGKNIRPRGCDFTAGTVLLPAGRRLDGVALSLAAASGLAQLPVARAPRIAILSSGDELAAPGSQPNPYQIFDSGTFGIAGLIQSWGGIPNRLAVEKDDVGAIARAAQEGLSASDLLVVIGGASVGDHDHARPALMRLGLSLAVEKIAVRPGKPTGSASASQGWCWGYPAILLRRWPAPPCFCAP
jgi:molybdopterin molybdotransferase